MGQEGTRRSALIISDDARFREWIGCIVTMRWPKMMLEHCRLTNAPMYLDRAELDRYQLIIVRTGFEKFAEVQTCIFLMRILALESHPEIIIISDEAEKLEQAKTTKLASAYFLPTNRATPGMFGEIFEDIADKARDENIPSADGAPVIPGYDILCPLAATYSTTVYRAFSEHLKRDVALKVCNSGAADQLNYHRLKLKDEYEVLRRFSSRNIARAFEYGEVNNLAYMALEYFPNGSLSKYIRENGRSVSRVDYLLQVAQALREIHDAGFLHLDLKPDNVLVREDGTPALIDFGISKRIVVAHYEEQQVFSLGSPYYMSPEQVCGEPLDVRSDIYSFGALWFRIFTGKVPFEGRSFDELRLARERPIPSMGYVLRHYQSIVDKTLAPNPDDRFSTAQELVHEIERYANSATGVHHCLDLQDILEAPCFQGASN